MKIILAENSGFCFGVEKAINTAIEVVNNENKKIYSLGPLIHNNQVINMLNKKGLEIIDDITDIDNGKIIIRSHGVPFNTIQLAKQRHLEIIDTTCPFVKKIQLKVKKYYEKGYAIVIIGNPKHPEVIGINGWCNNSAHIINSENDIDDIPKYDKICIVAQTTARKDKFNKLSKLISTKGREVKIFNTICNATKLRQEACKKVAKKADAIVVIGGFHSSNTQKLAQISRKFCPNTYHIETAEQLPLDKLINCDIVGVTAGASTPDWIIKEVIEKMNNANNKMSEMMKAIENTMVDIQRGDTVEGTVISVSKDEVMVNIGYKSDGIIKRNELTSDPFSNPENVVKVGDKIKVYVLSLDDGEGNVLLSKKRVDFIKGWNELEEIYNNKKTVKAKAVEVVKGGIIAIVNGIRGFIPASHISINYVKELKEFIGKEFSVEIIEFDKNKKRLVLSRKNIEKTEIEQKKNKLLESLTEGQKINGEVKRLTDFGAFVEIGGIDGLIHISELSWGRINHPSEVVKEGDLVETIVLKVDKENERISLSLKQIKPQPWENVKNRYSEGDVINGKVVKLTNFGAFVEIEPGLEGLVHISQISNEHIAKPSEKLTEGQKIKVKILNIKEEEKRMSLSIKEVNEDDVEKFKDYQEPQEEITVEDIMNNK
ncbi:bifunctional 4-hydroxy-3-methylbut-2-enyl diphosphate reductase/30S ribosomal protein S1 [Caldisalinibacter kiritimatiensis]|uniref:4-hydroxy-3-methylbut-2-enyl diphosphate reductase n=1 Tax=Caldisalinibacter kiritimatiensis TaxID=1304284 RepID=R1CYI5_9FIRM|nr:bifunctional 4-hydroxy-3-methylbut-2-enyl diphosphate reductase/30S ribosomal protein S1 [Caldisalinibacter kiritimatiensis]EOD01639.1 SSU ribosomal protein S1p [Caldisalinibacter kiritimatiensis]